MQARVRWPLPARRGLIRSHLSSGETGQVLDRDDARARRIPVKAVVEFVGIAPGLDQRHGRTLRQCQVSRRTPFVLKAPIDRWIMFEVNRTHAPPLLLRQYKLGLAPRYVKHR